MKKKKKKKEVKEEVCDAESEGRFACLAAQRCSAILCFHIISAFFQAVYCHFGTKYGTHHCFTESAEVNNFNISVYSILLYLDTVFRKP